MAIVCDKRGESKKCGFPGFIAPEILRGIPYNTKVDVFSMGAILFTCLSGREPI